MRSIPKMMVGMLQLLTALALMMPMQAMANQDVYSILPADIRILQYGLADLDGDTLKELAVLYTTGDEVKLTLFSGDTGHWTKWWDDEGVLRMSDGTEPKNIETADANGDGRAEILLYYLTDNSTTMSTRILALEGQGPSGPVFNIILEDLTAPPGYPLLGTEGASPSVTFLRMASEEERGYRRVYCWDGEKYEKCKEVVWEKP